LFIADRFDCFVPATEDHRRSGKVYAICVSWGQLDSRIDIRSTAARFGAEGAAAEGVRRADQEV
jgi:hypothetical protein